MAYAKQTWQNGTSGGTPINATRLNHMEDGIAAAADDAAQALAGVTNATAVAHTAAEDAAAAAASAASAAGTASTAASTVSTAASNASTALTNANRALTNAATADGKAVTADNKATAAQADATQALSDAAAALNSANAAHALASAAPRFAQMAGSTGSAAAGDINVRLQRLSAVSGTTNTFVTMTGNIDNCFTVTSAGLYDISVRIQSSRKAFGTGAYVQIVDDANRDPVYASTQPTSDSWWVTLERTGVYIPANTKVRILFHGGSNQTYAAGAINVYVSIAGRR